MKVLNSMRVFTMGALLTCASGSVAPDNLFVSSVMQRVNSAARTESVSLPRDTFDSIVTTPHIEASIMHTDSFVSAFTPPPPEGSADLNILAYAPKPDIVISGEKHKAAVVVDLGKNVLYKYDKAGNPETAYLVASGKKSTPTDPGVRIVTHIETYPYRGAPRRAKRRRAPRDYGPKIICLNKIDTLTGEQSPTGEFIHGNNNPASIGKYVSHGCIRMDNEVIKKLAEEVKSGDIVIIRK